MSQFNPLFILIDLLAIFSLLTGMFTTSLILFIIARKLTRRHTIANLLLANTCVCTLEICLSGLIFYSFIIISDSTSTTSFISLYDQQYLCPIRSYFFITGFALIYTSYCLQAYYRLRQVVFYQKHYGYKVFVYLCLIQWIFSFLLVLPTLLTKSFVYIPTEFFCPIPFTKPLSVMYIAGSVYGVFLTIFAIIYLWIYVYASRTTSITVRRRLTINRQLTMLKRIVPPAFSLMFVGIVFLSLFIQVVVNQYRTHFLTYRLSYLFAIVGISFIHVITIIQTPSIRNAVLELFYCLKGQIWKRNEILNTETDNPDTTVQQRKSREEKMATFELQKSELDPMIEEDKLELASKSRTKK